MKKPSGQTIEIQRGSNCHLLQVGLRQADIATAPESKRPYPLGERALNASALRIELAPFFTLKIGSHAIHGGLLWLRLQLEPARLGFGTGTARPLRACFENYAGLLAKRRTMSRIMASCSSVSLVWTLRS